MIKLFSILILIIFLLGSCFKMSEPEESQALPTPTPSLPDPSSEITMMLKTEDFVMEDWPVLDELFRLSGIKCVIKTIRPGQYNETLNLNLSSGIVYDIMELPPEYSEAADAYTVDVAPLLNQYGHNYIRWINTFSQEMLSSLATPEGEIKVFPLRQETGEIRAVPFIKKEVEGRQFDASSFYSAINQSGGRFAVPGSTMLLCELMAPHFNTSTGALIRNGELVYGPVTDEFKSMLLYLNSLYTNNMLSESFFVYTPTNMLYDIESGEVTAGIFPEKYYEQAYKAGMEPFMFSPVTDAHLLGYNNEPASYAAVTDVNGKAALAVQFIDFCFSDDGRRLLNNGIDGLHVKVFENGVTIPLKPYTRYDAYQWKEQGLTPEGMPGVYYNSWMKFDEPLYNLILPMRQYAPAKDTMASALPVTGTQATTSHVITGALNPLFHEWWTDFIVGNKSLSSDWSKYVRDINGAGLNIYINLHYK